jgi:hypothetical protein
MNRPRSQISRCLVPMSMTDLLNNIDVDTMDLDVLRDSMVELKAMHQDITPLQREEFERKLFLVTRRISVLEKSKVIQEEEAEWESDFVSSSDDEEMVALSPHSLRRKRLQFFDQQAMLEK